MQTLQQERAKHALKEVKALKDEKKEDGNKLTARASELPFMIHVNGLGQAAAFFKSKGDKDGYGRIYGLLSGWLTQPGRPFAGKADLMEAITQSDLNIYRMAQTEAMQYMDWVKKFANAYLKSEK
ncbi:MAG: type III-B CRISPR module-associated protein Cmr5 [Methylotenera sp.]|jgi:CRISPR-associated protein Cmr5|uniref:type III-B CRISPR module-associated protein Cmr5 n=1 Tax=Methylotenera sp. TaxID=2051956 RepID=UPI000D46CA21|nr:type III-B CRISPR module-associated protein Cmr5 [Methylotenera sp.]PPC84000.1 MAG: type III-B CRISPR module-associated protein Cmr5 [Methylotenera sp.]